MQIAALDTGRQLLYSIQIGLRGGKAEDFGRVVEKYEKVFDEPRKRRNYAHTNEKEENLVGDLPVSAKNELIFEEFQAQNTECYIVQGDTK